MTDRLPGRARVGEARSVRVLVVAAPFVSQGGVYTSLRRTLPTVMEAGVEVGVLWSSRAPGGELPGDWVVKIGEPHFSALRQAALVRGLRGAIRRWAPDVLLSVLPQSDVACAAVIATLDIPWIAMIRGRPFPTGSEASALKSSVWKAVVKRAYRSATVRIAVSAGLAEELRDGIDVEIDKVVYNGVDIDEHPFRARTAEEREIGFVGRLANEKSPLVVCDIARVLDRPVHIFGDGPLRSQIDEIAAEDPRIRVHGWLPSAEAMQKIDLLVVPSRREGFGNVILEAGASGVIPVARRVGGVPEILERDELARTYCLVPEEADASEFAAAVRRLLDDSRLRSDLARRLHDLVKRDFSVQRSGGNLAAVICQADGRALQVL